MTGFRIMKYLNSINCTSAVDEIWTWFMMKYVSILFLVLVCINIKWSFWCYLSTHNTPFSSNMVHSMQYIYENILIKSYLKRTKLVWIGMKRFFAYLNKACIYRRHKNNYNHRKINEDVFSIPHVFHDFITINCNFW